ncbi:MAG: tripartite tricarboxylate transporter TctB family protein [Azospirillaceae bacterium]
MRISSATADFVTAVVFFAIGMAMLIGGYTMDRLEFRDIHPASIPGLLPMFLGAALMICAVLLALSARKAWPADDADATATAAPDAEREDDGGTSSRNLVVAGGLSLVYALILVGWLPFFVATAIYIAVFIFVFSAPFKGSGRRLALITVLAAGFGLAMSAAIAGLFQYGFLVRLP